MATVAQRRALIQRVVTSQWRSEREKLKLLRTIEKEGLSSSEVTPLMRHRDGDVKRIGLRLFLAKVNVTSLIKALTESHEAKDPPSWNIRLLGRVSPSLMDAAIAQLVAGPPDKGAAAWVLVPHLPADIRTRFLARGVLHAPEPERPAMLRQLLRDEKAENHIDLLLRCTRTEDTALVRVAFDGTGVFYDERLVRAALGQVSSTNLEVRNAAFAYLQRVAHHCGDQIRAPLFGMLKHGDHSVRRMALGTLIGTGDPDMVRSILLQSRTMMGFVRARLMQSLSSLGEPAVAAAVELLKSPEPEIKTAALVMAESFSDRRLLEPCMALLEDADPWVRLLACDTLGRIGNPAAIDALVDALEDPDTRWAAAEAIGRIGGLENEELLTGLLSDPRVELRLEAIRALSEITVNTTFDSLINVALKDPSVEVRARATEVVRSLGRALDLAVPEEELTRVAPDASTTPIDQLLARGRAIGASDVHLKAGEPPFIRVNGELVRMPGAPPLTPEDTVSFVAPVLSEHQREAIDLGREVDLCHVVPEVGRYRANIYMDRQGLSAAFRVVPTVPPTLEKSLLPEQLSMITDMSQGLVVVCGPTGSGKSTTLAALVNLLNDTKPCHIITIEDPIEMLHPRKRALISQREIGEHTLSFADGLRAALREDPDVILVGEMRDRETIRLGITAAETGHLVLGTLHTHRAHGVVDRMIESFPAEQQQQMRMTLADTLKLVVAQQLLPRKDGWGRVPQVEMLRVIPSVAGLIREKKTHQIPNIMVTGRSNGMQTVDMALLDLVQKGLISAEMGFARSDNPQEFESLLGRSIEVGP